MSGIPVLASGARGIARAWENSLVLLHNDGCRLTTEYDKPDDSPSIDATMLITVEEPMSEPMIHLDLPGGLEDLQEYVMEVLEGTKDHLVRDQSDPDDQRWEYTYHQRLFAYTVPSISVPFDQIENMCQYLAKTPYTRRAQASTWKVWEDNDCYDPACLQSIWCRIIPEGDEWALSMNVRFRSRDAYKAALMNMFALVMLQARMAKRIAYLADRPVTVGRYCDLSDSYHIYGSNLAEFESRFMGAMRKRTFEQRTVRYEDVKEDMEAARPALLEKARKMGRD
jgi:thymidylate synthase